MSAFLATESYSSVIEEMSSHPAWCGDIRGLHAEKLLRGQSSYRYLLRSGETRTESEADYYVSFVLPNGSIHHQPFIITETSQGWFFENGGGGPLEEIDAVLHLIMHCRKEQCVPFSKVG